MPTLVYRKGGRPNAYVFAAHDAPVLIGRGLDCTIIVDDGDVSRKHAEIFTQDGGVTWFVRDLGSANGTFLNGSRIDEAEIVDTDTLRCGRLHFEFRRGPETSRISLSREGVAFRHGRSTPVRNSHAVGEHFRVHEATPAPNAITQESRKIGNNSALLQRVRELEQQLQATERENTRLRQVIDQLVDPDEIDLNAYVEQPTDDSAETIREHLIQSVTNLQNSALSAVAELIQAERRKNPLFDRVSHIVTRSKERQRVQQNDDE